MWRKLQRGAGRAAGHACRIHGRTRAGTWSQPRSLIRFRQDCNAVLKACTPAFLPRSLEGSTRSRKSRANVHQIARAGHHQFACRRSLGRAVGSGAPGKPRRSARRIPERRRRRPDDEGEERCDDTARPLRGAVAAWKGVPGPRPWRDPGGEGERETGKKALDRRGRTRAVAFMRWGVHCLRP